MAEREVKSRAPTAGPAQAHLEEPDTSPDSPSPWLLATGAAVVAGLLTYAVNGQEFVRAGIAALLWLVIGWYGGKVLYRRALEVPDGAVRSGQE